MDALKVFYRIRHDQGILDALLCDLSFVFATGCQFQAMAAVQAQCTKRWNSAAATPTRS